MIKNFFIADHHFGHKNTFELFKLSTGEPLRPFKSLEEMHDIMIKKHNSVVTDEDRVYFLGDVTLGKQYLPLVANMKGRKVLIKGNHDNQKADEYLKYFEDIRASHTIGDFVLTHIPVHPYSMDRWKVNIHGHLHSYNIIANNGELDKRYFNVSVEQLNYTPISLTEIKDKLNV